MLFAHAIRDNPLRVNVSSSLCITEFYLVTIFKVLICRRKVAHISYKYIEKILTKRSSHLIK